MADLKQVTFSFSPSETDTLHDAMGDHICQCYLEHDWSRDDLEDAADIFNELARVCSSYYRKGQECPRSWDLFEVLQEEKNNA